VAVVAVDLMLNAVVPVVEQLDKMLLFVPLMENTEKVEHRLQVAPADTP
jgi:hypothetical protein